MLKSNWPQHVGIIMDGNGRWAQGRGWKRLQGHVQGADRVITIIDSARESDIKTLSLFCFSTENWKRPNDEVAFLMDLMAKFVEKQLERLKDSNVRVRVLGNMDKAPPLLQEKLRNCIELTKTNNGLNLNFMMSYGGRNDILQACTAIAEKVANAKLKLEDLSEEIFAQHLYTAELEDPDLIIRTSGEFRVSNFMLWQAAYSEFYVTPKYWPDFTPEDFKIACEYFAGRNRRFGCVTEQNSNTHTEGAPLRARSETSTELTP